MTLLAAGLTGPGLVLALGITVSSITILTAASKAVARVVAWVSRVNTTLGRHDRALRRIGGALADEEDDGHHP